VNAEEPERVEPQNDLIKNDLIKEVAEAGDASGAMPMLMPVSVTHLRYYRPNLILHSIFLLMSGGIIFMSVVMSVTGPTTVLMPGLAMPMPETCISRRVFGRDCPGCGLTRSFISMSHGKLGDAFEFNNSGPIIYLFVLIQIPWHLYQISRILRRKHPVESMWLYTGIFLVSGAMFLQWILKLF
jgi:hypothetical protein